MNLRSILLATLAAAPLHGCLGTNCGAVPERCVSVIWAIVKAGMTGAPSGRNVRATEIARRK